MKDKVAIAIDRLKEFEPEDGYLLCNSGRKDSSVCRDLLIRSGVKWDAEYRQAMEPPEVYNFIRYSHPETKMIHPLATMWKIIVANGTPPTRQMRYCCRELKEIGGSGRLCITGIRWEESPRRAKRRMVEICSQDKTKTFLHPIIDWSTKDVWEYIHKYAVPYCSLYDEGFTRVGCVLCPNSRQTQRDIDRWPKIADAYRRAINRAWTKRHDRGDVMAWKDGDAMYHWWLDRSAKDTRIQNAQNVLFDDDGIE
jgi:phosphoadenosine phosphosulfate reductase